MQAAAGGATAGMGAIYEKRMYDIKQADWENMFEEYILPTLMHERETFWPIQTQLKGKIQARLEQEPEEYFRLRGRMGREDIGKRTAEGVRMAQEYATQSRMGSGPQAEVISRVIGQGAESEAELARNLILARTGEESQRIAEASAFAGRPGPPPTGIIGQMPMGEGGGEEMGFMMGQLLGAGEKGMESYGKYRERERLEPYYQQFYGGGGGYASPTARGFKRTGGGRGYEEYTGATAGGSWRDWLKNNWYRY